MSNRNLQVLARFSFVCVRPVSGLIAYRQHYAVRAVRKPLGRTLPDTKIENKTEIYFIRILSEVTKSFITLEFKNGRVVQKELPHHNRNFTDEQNAFIDKWLGFRSFIEKKEKYKKKQEIKVIKYNFKKMAA